MFFAPRLVLLLALLAALCSSTCARAVVANADKTSEVEKRFSFSAKKGELDIGIDLRDEQFGAGKFSFSSAPPKQGSGGPIGINSAGLDKRFSFSSTSSGAPSFKPPQLGISDRDESAGDKRFSFSGASSNLKNAAQELGIAGRDESAGDKRFSFSGGRGSVGIAGISAEKRFSFQGAGSGSTSGQSGQASKPVGIDQLKREVKAAEASKRTAAHPLDRRTGAVRKMQRSSAKQ